MNTIGINSFAKGQIEWIKEKCDIIRPLVVIRCITYNHEPYIRDALDGFVMQKTDFPYIAIVHDDASTDNTAKIISEYAEKYPDIILPILEKENQYSKGNGSIGRILNPACESTGAKYIALCEGDDYWTDPLKLQKQVDFLESHPEYGMCYTSIYRFDESINKNIEEWGGPNETFVDLLLCNTIPTLTSICRIDLYKKYINTIKPENKNWKMGDYPIWLFFSIYSKLYFLSEVTGTYRILRESASHTKSLRKRYDFDKNYKEIGEFFIDNFKESVNEDVVDRFIQSKFDTLLPMAIVLNDEKIVNLAHSYYKNRRKSFKIWCLMLPKCLIRLPLLLKYRLQGYKD